jgi:hypothetical protein
MLLFATAMAGNKPPLTSALYAALAHPYAPASTTQVAEEEERWGGRGGGEGRLRDDGDVQVVVVMMWGVLHLMWPMWGQA